MDFSICIVSYECRDKLRQCLTSIRAHRPVAQHEVIVVDNGSTDGTVAMLHQEFYWVKTIANPDNRGLAVACNQGLAQASGEVLMVLDPDTIVTHGALDGLYGFVKERPWIGAVGPKLVTPEGKPEMSCREFPTLMNALWNLTGLSQAFSSSKVFGHYEMSWWDHSAPRAVDWLSSSALVFTSAAWVKVGALDESYFLQAVELDWQKRLSRNGLERWYLPSVEIQHHPGRSWGGEESDEVVALHEAAFRYFRKHHGLLSSLCLHALAFLTLSFRLPWSALKWLTARGEQSLQELRTNWGIYRLSLGIPVPRSAPRVAGPRIAGSESKSEAC